jgi:hypothetical protein
MEVLRRAPASLAEQLIQLPPHLWPLVAGAHVPGLAAATPIPNTSEVLHSAPAPPSKMPMKVPAPLWPVQGLSAAAHSPLAEGSGEDMPVLTLCLDTTASAVNSTRIPACLKNEDLSSASMWPIASIIESDGDVADAINESTCKFTLEARARTMVCRLRAKSRELADITISLPPAACLVIGSASRGMHLRNVTFKGVQPL